MKNRILISKALMLLVIAIAFLSHHPYDDNTLLDIALEIFGYLFLISAAMGRTWVSAYISGRKNQVLVTEGPYSVVRNPLYFFSFLGFIGAGLAFESFVITLLLGFIFFFTHWKTILDEETQLRRMFGEQFDEYAQTTPRFIPKTWKLRNPSTVSFSPKVFSRAAFDSFFIALIFSLTHIIEWTHVNSVVPILFYLP